MKKIWKFQLQVTDTQIVEMPVGAEILSLQVQHSVPCIWALVDDHVGREKVTFTAYGTGHDVYHRSGYVGTYQLHTGTLVFHVFRS